MKRFDLYLLLIILLFSGNKTFSQNWTVKTSPRYRQIHDIHLHNPYRITIVGGHHWNDSITYMALTENAGDDWVRFTDIYPGKLIRSLVFFDYNHGICVGDAEAFYETFDGGKTWIPKELNINLNNRRINKIILFQDSIVYGIGGQDAEHGFIIKSKDKAETWEIIYDWEGNEILSVAVPKENYIVAGGTNAFLKLSEDNGLNWFDANINTDINLEDYVFNSIEFFDQNIGYCVGGLRGADSVTLIIKTQDGGQNWDIVKLKSGPCLNDIEIISENNIIAVGDVGFVVKSLDSGETWSLEHIPDNPGFDMFSVKFLNEYYGAITTRWGYLIIFQDKAAELPIVNTSEATNVFYTSGNLHGIVCPGNIETDVFLKYGYLENLDNIVFAGIYNGNEYLHINYIIDSLEPFTEYYYQVYTLSEYGLLFGETKSFYTDPELIFIEALTAIDISASSSTVRTRFNPGNLDSEIFLILGENYYELNDTIHCGLFSNAQVNEFEYVIENLKSNSEYFYSFFIKNQIGDFFSEKQSFITNSIQEEIRIFPNPTEKFVNIDFGGISAVIIKIYIIDNKGSVVLYEELISIQNLIIDLSSLNHGNYKIIINLGDEVFIYSIVKV